MLEIFDWCIKGFIFDIIGDQVGVEAEVGWMKKMSCNRIIISISIIVILIGNSFALTNYLCHIISLSYLVYPLNNYKYVCMCVRMLCSFIMPECIHSLAVLYCSEYEMMFIMLLEGRCSAWIWIRQAYRITYVIKHISWKRAFKSVPSKKFFNFEKRHSPNNRITKE